MEIGKTLRVTTRKAWRTWLEKNHARKKEIWLVYATKQSGQERVAYSDAVEEALCFGWIDGIMKASMRLISRNASVHAGARRASFRRRTRNASGA
jgi:uncharacterized protein YdeI (YjbR/CyaY-like superfamily)